METAVGGKFHTLSQGLREEVERESRGRHQWEGYNVDQLVRAEGKRGGGKRRGGGEKKWRRREWKRDQRGRWWRESRKWYDDQLLTVLREGKVCIWRV